MPELQWQRLLWEQQPYPDNYVPRSFLSSLSTNRSVKPYTYWPLVLSSCAITQHLSSIFIFLATFVRLYSDTFDPRLLVFISVGMFATGYTTWEVLDCVQAGSNHAPSDRRAKAVKASILVFLALIALAPILRTLTAATSSDSIWALSACLFLLNAVLADYSSARRGGYVRERLTSVLSMNAAISAAVVLASRLHDDLSVFALVLFSVQLFALFPILRHRLQTLPGGLQYGLTIAIAAFALAFTAPLSTRVMYMALLLMLCTSIVAPAILVWAQRYKNEIHGPWDAATPKVQVGRESTVVYAQPVAVSGLQ
ncbi:phosphatidylinositol N-acetylglucosaminyltransferase [Amylostereum chailletii]|nr:phosphatidylinositol N-acetylglucosaminyltransferase [Amylostereum chailletii]